MGAGGGSSAVEVRGLVDAIRQVPAAVAVFDATAAIVDVNARARALSETGARRVVDEECVHLAPGGARVVLRCSSSPVRGPEGAVVAGVLVMLDITDVATYEGDSSRQELEGELLATDHSRTAS